VNKIKDFYAKWESKIKDCGERVEAVKEYWCSQIEYLTQIYEHE